MTIDEFIAAHFNDMKDVCTAYMGKSMLSDDLLQEAAIVLLEKRQCPKLLAIIDRGEGMYHFAGIVRMMVTLPGHKFYYTFISPKKVNKEEWLASKESRASDQIKMLNEVDDIVSKMRWYKKELWRLYFEESYSFTKLADETGISRKSLYNDVTKIRNEVKITIHDRKYKSN